MFCVAITFASKAAADAELPPAAGQQSSIGTDGVRIIEPPAPPPSPSYGGIGFWPAAKQWTTRGELSLSHDRQFASSVSLVSPFLGAEYGISERFSLSMAWGATLYSSSPDVGSTEHVAAAGNPYAAFHYRYQIENWRGRVGLGSTLPLARVPRDAGGRSRLAAYNWSMNIRGLWDLWQWAPERMAVVLPAELEWDAGKGAWFRLEGASALMIPIYAFDTSLDLILQTAATLGYSQGPVRIGMRLLGVALPSHPQTRLHTAIEPLVQVRVGEGFLTARYTINVGEPLGEGRGVSVWGLHLGGGLRF